MGFLTTLRPLDLDPRELARVARRGMYAEFDAICCSTTVRALTATGRGTSCSVAATTTSMPSRPC